jgi:hypothetical protein
MTNMWASQRLSLAGAAMVVIGYILRLRRDTASSNGQSRHASVSKCGNLLNAPSASLDQPHGFPFKLIRETPLFVPAHSYLLYLS